MILRIARFTVAQDQEDAVVRCLREQAGTLDRPDGLEDLIFALSRPDGSTAEFVTVTLWDRLESVMLALGSAWDAPGGVDGLAATVTDQRVEHLEVFADDWPELVQFLGLPADARRALETGGQQPALGVGPTKRMQ